MKSNKHQWVIILAAGEGTRLKSLTTNEEGVIIPKQFCCFRSTKSMLSNTIERAKLIVSHKRIVVVVSSNHRQWWETELSKLPKKNIIVQPKSGGTAIAILLPVLQIFMRDHLARICILPSDHYVENEKVLQKIIRKIITSSQKALNRLILLGIKPTSLDADYGWIVPYSKDNSLPYKVRMFVEKPPISEVNNLMKVGALWNSFVMIGMANTFLKLYKKALPEFTRNVLATYGSQKNFLHSQVNFENFPSLDFSHDLLERMVSKLSVIPIPPCGWSDLGTPYRIRELANYLSSTGYEAVTKNQPILSFPERKSSESGVESKLQRELTL